MAGGISDGLPPRFPHHIHQRPHFGRELFAAGVHRHHGHGFGLEIAIEFDSDPKQARASRQAELKDAATRKIWIAGAHMPFPGIGHIRAKSNGSYTWLPVEYTLIEIDGKVQ